MDDKILWPSRLLILILLVCSMAFVVAYADWYQPSRISDSYAIMPAISYSNEVLHAIYQGTSDSVYYVRSTDMGITWSDPFKLMNARSEYPWIMSSGDTVIASWKTIADNGYYRYNYYIRKSLNGGRTWEAASSIFSSNTENIYDHKFCFSGQNLIFAYIYYQNGTKILIKTSHNLGQTWGNPDTLYSQQSIGKLEFTNYGDTLLLCFNARHQSGDDDEVIFFRSSNAGINWSEMQIISRDDNCISYNPHMAINESGGVAVCWAAGGGNYNSDLLIRLSHDLGLSWDSTLINPEFNGWADFDIAYAGDTLHLVSGGGRYMRHRSSNNNGPGWLDIDIIDFDRYESYDPEIVLSPGMAHVVWDDRRYHSPGIYYSGLDHTFIREDTLAPELLIVGNHSLPAWTNWSPNLCAAGNYIYISGSPYEHQQCVNIVDVSNPEHPNIVGNTDSLHYPIKMAISGNSLNLACGDNGGFVTFDISDPLNPEFCSIIPQNGILPSLCTENGLIYFVSPRHITIFEYVDSCQTSEISDFDSLIANESLRDIDVDEGIAYLLAFDEMFIIDVSDPTHPIFLSRYMTRLSHSEEPKIAASRGYAYIVSGTPEVEVVNATDPVHPSYSSTFPLDWGGAVNIKTRANYLLIAHKEITVADISTPGNPSTLARYSGPIQFYDADLDDEYIYADADHLLEIFACRKYLLRMTSLKCRLIVCFPKITPIPSMPGRQSAIRSPSPAR